MVKEAYCSFEVAKLLKEKGFEQHKCRYSYNSKGVFKWSDDLDPYEYSAPTHQMACAWVRSKGYSVEVHATAVGWHWEVCKVNGTSIAFGGTIPSDKTNDGDAYDDYDECMDNALMYTLTNLI